jgi:hypothetical protein
LLSTVPSQADAPDVEGERAGLSPGESGLLVDAVEALVGQRAEL